MKILKSNGHLLKNLTIWAESLKRWVIKFNTVDGLRLKASQVKVFMVFYRSNDPNGPRKKALPIHVYEFAFGIKYCIRIINFWWEDSFITWCTHYCILKSFTLYPQIDWFFVTASSCTSTLAGGCVLCLSSVRSIITK
jgi:hypothetical protein